LANSSNRYDQSAVAKGIRGLLSGNVSFTQALREGFRRGRAVVERRRERALLADRNAQTLHLLPQFQQLSSADLLTHFRARESPRFLPGFEDAETHATEFRTAFPDDTRDVIAAAWRITREKRWPLLGFGLKEFGDPIDWRRDPLSGRVWPLDYHADITLWHNDGSDIRVLWELNRLGHLITLGRAYALTNEAAFASEFFSQLETWQEQNPLGRGPNWSCAMEVALRAMNLLAAWSLFRKSPSVTEAKLAQLLRLFEQHGAHIRRNLEFSYVATSNHYLSDVVGLLWLGIMLPELSPASEWRGWALAQMLREIEKQVLSDGAHYEGSTGYHRFVLELFLYSFILCRANEIPIAARYWDKLCTMLDYLKAILRPDGAAPLIGDTDGGQVLPLVAHTADDHAYLLTLGAAVFEDFELEPAHLTHEPEQLWILGLQSFRNYEQFRGDSSRSRVAGGTRRAHVTPLQNSAAIASRAFPEAGTYVLRENDLYLLFNANSAHKHRPASHQHNDALSIEVSAGGRAFIVDPGTYVYTADLHQRHLFRATGYHSTVQVDGAEQNSVSADAPFVFGAEARVSVLAWHSTREQDQVVAEHSGYERLPQPARHRRTITFHKSERWWLVADAIAGEGEHEIAARFHFAPGLEVKAFEQNHVIARDALTGVQLLVISLDLDQPATLEAQFTARHYGCKEPSVSVCWTTQAKLPVRLRWAIVPVSDSDDPAVVLTVRKSEI
jgi:hypothetical protein